MRLINTHEFTLKQFENYLDKMIPLYVENTSNYLLNHKFTLMEKLQNKNKGKGGLKLGIALIGKDKMKVQMIIETKKKIMQELDKKGKMSLDDFVNIGDKAELYKQGNTYQIEEFKG